MESNKKFGIIIGILIIIILVMGFYIVYDKVFFSLEDSNKNKESSAKVSEKNTSKEKEDIDKDNEVTNKENEGSTNTCYGNYYGETSGTLPNGLSYDYKYTYVLNNDGTYTADFGGVSGNSGTYKIENGKVSFTHMPEVTGTDSNEIVDTYAISADCSTITINVQEGSFNLIRK